MKDGATNGEIVALIGEDGLTDFAEAFGGMRLFIPVKMSRDHAIAAAIGLRKARALSKRFAPDYLRVPLARELRACRYREQGMSNGRIAHRLGMTEPAVNRLFQRIRDSGGTPPAKGASVSDGEARHG